MRFKSKGMQWCKMYQLNGRHNEIMRSRRSIAYWTPEERLETENLEILHDSREMVILWSPERRAIYEFKNN